VLVGSALAGVGAPRLTHAATHAATDASGTLTVELALSPEDRVRIW